MRFVLPVIFWAVMIFFLSSRQSQQVSGQYWINFILFKSLHVLEYFIFFILVYRALKNSVVAAKYDLLAITFLLTVAYGAWDEVHQLFVPTREGKVRDIFIDSLGSLLAWTLLWKLSLKVPKRLVYWVNKLQIA